MNIAVIQGKVRDDLDRRVAQDGSLLVSFDVTVEGDGAPQRHVPVSWVGPQGSEPSLKPGQRVTVLGEVVRRFYRSGGATASRTDVRAHQVIRGAGARAAAAVSAYCADPQS